MKKPKISGIYAAVNRLNGHLYIGSSSDIYRRWNDHRKLLRKGSHPTPYFQNAWNKYEESAFDWVILETCLPEPTMLVARESEWMKNNVGKMYNFNNDPSPRYQKPFSEQHRARLSLAHKGRKRGPLGYVPSSKINEKDVPEICNRYAGGEPTSVIARDYGISTWSIPEIVGRKTWKHVPVDPEIEEACLSRIKSRKSQFPTIAKLNYEQVQEIRQRLINGDKQSHLAREFGISIGSMTQIASGKTYKYVPWPESPNAPPRNQARTAIRGRNPSLSDDEVRHIRKLLEEGMTCYSIGKRYKVCHSVVRQIRDRRTYRYVD